MFNYSVDEKGVLGRVTSGSGHKFLTGKVLVGNPDPAIYLFV